MTNLENIFYKTQKHAVKWSTYFDVYERHLKKFQNKSPKILEIGINDGGSTEMWLEYFGKNTQIFAIDIDERCKDHSYNGNVITTIGDQGSEQFWDEFLIDKDGFDIILDDGGHTMKQQITTLNKVFAKLNNGGVFLIEDTHTSYWKDWGGEFKNPSTLMEYTKNLTDILNIQHFDSNLIDQNIKNIYSNLYMVSFYNGIVILEKRPTETSAPLHNR
jgi:hypothetical protein